MLLTSLLSLTAGPPQDLRPFAPLDVFQLESVRDPRISPDGKRIVYERQRFEVQEDRARTTLWIVDENGGGHRPLSDADADARGARWSPDGGRLAFLRPTEHGAQVFVRWMDSGTEHKVTNLPETPGSLSWSPDGTHIAFLARVPDVPQPWAEMPTAPEGAQWAEPPVVIESVRYRADGEGYLEAGHEHLFVVPADGGTPRQLTHGDFDHGGPPTWTPDGRAILVSSNRRADRDMEPQHSDLYRIPLAGGEAQTITDRYGPDRSPAVSPDGKWLAWTGYDERKLSEQAAHLYVMPLEGGEVRDLTPDLDRSVDTIAWDATGIVFSYDDHGERRLARVSHASTSAGGAAQVRELPARLQGAGIGRPYTGGSFSVSAAGGIAFQQAAPDRPAELGFLGSAGEARVLTDLHADLAAQIRFAVPEEAWVTSSHDGRRIQSWILYPPDFSSDAAAPLILEIHGGPHAAYGPVFSPELQLMAAAGYVVVYSNPRGSTSYGADFTQLIHHNYPSEDYDDLMSVVDGAIARGGVDPERLFVTGGSGGGVLTAWIVGKTDRFRAAVVAKPVIHWLSFALTADAYPYFTQWWFPSMPWEDPDAYWKRSPLSLVGNVTTPTMLLTGEADYRTPISESEQYYQALKLRGIETAMVRIPGASHGIASRPSRLLYKCASILAWFEKHDAAE